MDSAGKTMFIALLGTVSLEVALVSRFWTWLFAFFLALSYFLVYPFEVPLPNLAKPSSEHPTDSKMPLDCIQRHGKHPSYFLVYPFQVPSSTLSKPLLECQQTAR